MYTPYQAISMFMGGGFNDSMINDPSLFVQKSTQTSPVSHTVSQVSSLMRGRQLSPEAMRRKVSRLVRSSKSLGK